MHPRGEKTVGRGRREEESVCTLLRAYGRKVDRQTHVSRFDILVDGQIKIEVKSLYPVRTERGVIRWRANIHHGGKIDESYTHFYVFCFNNVPHMRQKLYLLYKAPINSMTVGISMRRLIRDAGVRVKSFNLFCRGKYQESENVLIWWNSI